MTQPTGPEAPSGRIDASNKPRGLPPPAEPRPADRKVTGRLTMVRNAYYQGEHGQPLHAELRKSLWLSSADQPYVRHLTIGPEWVPLDPGWIKEASLLVLKNLEGSRLQRVPTPAERAAIEGRILELGTVVSVNTPEPTPPPPPQPPKAKARTMWDGPPSAPPPPTLPPESPAGPRVIVAPLVLVRPGGSADFEPADLGLLFLRCREGWAKATLVLFPL